MHDFFGARQLCGVLLACLLTACGGGDDDDTVSVSVTPGAISFSAASPEATTPAPRIVTATFGANVAQLSVTHDGPAIAGVRSILDGRTAQITIDPSTPASVGAGVFTGTVAITGQVCANVNCSSLIAGGTAKVSVQYQVSPVVRLVMPYVATAGKSDTVIIRGVGFRAHNVSGVKFGAIAALSSTVVSDTEIQATHPALTAGRYEVQIDASGHQGPITSMATLAVVDPVTFAAGTLAYPTAPASVKNMVYDTERDALLVATDAAGGTLLRYPHQAGPNQTGLWEAASSATIGQLQDITLSTNGAQLLAIAKTALIPIEPVTLVPGTPLKPPALATDNFLKNIVVAHDSLALITTGSGASKATSLYGYNLRTAALTELSASLNNATPAIAANGSRAVLVQGDPKLTSDPAVSTYVAATSAFGNATVSLKQNAVAPAMDRTATRIALNGVKVYSGDFDQIGTLPATTLAVVFRPDGKRAYTYDSAAGAILTFDTSTDRNDTALPRLGPAVALAGHPGTGVKMIISLDGSTLFLAGNAQIVVQPTLSEP